MTTITIPINKELETFINEEIREGVSDSKAHVVRYALSRLQEERALTRLKEAEDDVKNGRIYKGDLKQLLSKF